MSKTFKQIRENSPPPSLLHRSSVLILIFFPNIVSGGSPSSIYFPIVPAMLEKHGEEIYGLHLIERPANVENLIRAQGKRNINISGAIDFKESFLEESIKGVEDYIDPFLAMFKVKGKTLTMGFDDLYTIPDRSGRKWVDYERMFSTFPEEYVTRDIIVLHSKITKTIYKFYETFIDRFSRQSALKNGYEPALEVLKNYIRNNTPIQSMDTKHRKDLEFWIKVYIEGSTKIMEKYMKDLKDLLLLSRLNARKNENHAFTEVLISDFEILEAWMYHKYIKVADNDRRMKKIKMANAKTVARIKSLGIPFTEYRDGESDLFINKTDAALSDIDHLNT